MKIFLSIVFSCISMGCSAQSEISYWKDERKNLKKKDILRAKFSPLPDNQFNIGTDSSYHWLKFDIKSANAEKMFMEINSPSLIRFGFIMENWN